MGSVFQRCKQHWITTDRLYTFSRWAAERFLVGRVARAGCIWCGLCGGPASCVFWTAAAPYVWVSRLKRCVSTPQKVRTHPAAQLRTRTVALSVADMRWRGLPAKGVLHPVPGRRVHDVSRCVVCAVAFRGHEHAVDSARPKTLDPCDAQSAASERDVQHTICYPKHTARCRGICRRWLGASATHERASSNRTSYRCATSVLVPIKSTQNWVRAVRSCRRHAPHLTKHGVAPRACCMLSPPDRSPPRHSVRHATELVVGRSDGGRHFAMKANWQEHCWRGPCRHTMQLEQCNADPLVLVLLGPNGQPRRHSCQ